MKCVASSLMILSCSLFLFSCAGVRRMHEDIASSREKEPKAFVEKKDGQIIPATEARMRSPLFGKTTIELDGDVRIPVKEVEAYQNDYAYYRKTPSGFAPRFKKGPLNMYVATERYMEYEAPSMSNGSFGGTRQRTRYVYYIQKGNGASVVSFTPEIVESYVSDYAPALDFMNEFNATQKKVRTWSIINTTAVLGGLVLAATAGVDNTGNKLTAAGYAGIGLFLGGLINGFVNKVRRGKNYRNLELAVDAYNHQPVKKKK